MHESYMQRCIQLAQNGLGTASPNPMVGAVVVHQDRIIGEGWHQKAGEAHAEVRAIAAVKDKSLLPESTIYVSLEPCAHFGKTPPCSDLIIESQIPEVVIGCRDPFAEVNGKGVTKLQAAGIRVAEHILQDACEFLNRRFFTFHGKKRPYIILKWAQSQDGMLDRDRSDGDSGINWITGPETRSLVHQWRSDEDAILVGANTLITDNPSLTVRDVAGKNPVRMALVGERTLPKELSFNDGSAKSVIFSPADPHLENCEWCPTGSKVLQDILQYCYEHNLQSLIVEGGSQLLQSFLAAGLWDEARVLSGPHYLGSGLPAPALPAASHQQDISLNSDHLSILYR